MKKKRIAAVIVGFIIIFAFLAFLLLKDLLLPERVEKLRIGVTSDPISALIYIAQEQGMFKRHGLDVSVVNCRAGAYAVNDLLEGKADVAAASEFVLVLQSFKRPDLRTVGIISTSDTIEMVARADHGIKKPEDLKGKRIAATKGTNSEFFLNAFLSLNGVHPAEVQMVDLKSDDMVTALSEGKIDGAVTLFSFLEPAKRRLGDEMVSWSAQSGQDFFFLLITKNELIKARPEAITRLLKGVLEAEAFLKKNEKEARSIVERILKLDRGVVMGTWSKTRFRVGLDQNLLTLMEDEARWAITNKYVDSTKIPNYFNFLYLEGLKKIKPEAVSVIH